MSLLDDVKKAQKIYFKNHGLPNGWEGYIIEAYKAVRDTLLDFAKNDGSTKVEFYRENTPSEFRAMRGVCFPKYRALLLKRFEQEGFTVRDLEPEATEFKFEIDLPEQPKAEDFLSEIDFENLLEE